MDVEVSGDALRAVIHDNLFEADSLVAQVDKNNEQLESVLADMRTAYQERWKSLPDANYRANEELLTQFEKSAREKPLDREKTRSLLQKVIDATPRQP
jgi:F0F1-type ATP synthase membrane subunit b/b'